MSKFSQIYCRPSYHNYSINSEEKGQDIKRIAGQVAKDYLSNSPIHGFIYLNTKQLWKRVFWLCMITISIFCCLTLIFKTYQKWNETPVIVSFSERSTPVWHIPFPAITVCSETKANKDIVSFTEIYRKLLNKESENGKIFLTNQTSTSEKEFEYLQTLLQICSTSLVENIESSEINVYNTINYANILDEIIPKFNKTYPFCRWKNVFDDCSNLFKKVYTEQGICYTFNGLNAKELYREETFQYKEYIGRNNSEENRLLEWSLENGYDENVNENVIPNRVLGAGIRAGIFMALQGFKQNIDYICRGPVQGFKVILHSPDDFPQVSKQFLRIPFNKEVLVSVIPKMITTSEVLRYYSPERRQCFFSTERYLRYYNIYTQGNCEIECYTNFTLSKCGCVQFSMPSKKLLSILSNNRLYSFIKTGTSDNPVCNVTQIKCLYAAEHELLRNEFVEGLKKSSDGKKFEDGKKGNIYIKCNCLPACTSLVYQSEISQADFDMNSLLKAYNDTSYIDNNPGFQMSRILIFFKENQFMTSRRSELYGILDFLANCGGLFGLFMGFSVLSLVDVIYYLVDFLMQVKQAKERKVFEINSNHNRFNSFYNSDKF